MADYKNDMTLSEDMLQELEDLRSYKQKMELQWLDDINNPLEPLKLTSALNSEIMKYEYRKEHDSSKISELDITIMYALQYCLNDMIKKESEG